MSLLLNPKAYDQEWPDPKTRDIMHKTIAFFEKKGLRGLKEDDEALRWQDDFIGFQKEEEIFSSLLTPAAYGDSDARFDLSRVCPYNEILAFYGSAFQFAYHVSILGLCPIWMGNNEGVKQKAARILKNGGVFAFGLSEKEHGADLYSNEMKLYPQPGGAYRADGSKYYIGNANVASLVSVQGRFTDTDEYAFFVVESRHRNYKLVKRIRTSGLRSAFVGEFELVNYPVTGEEILSSGQSAWEAALSTVNIGKFQSGFTAIGICTHALYEAINHASRRILFGSPVASFPHIRKFFTEAYVRLCAMKLFALRSLDYLRSSSSSDRRYLLFNPIQKTRVATEGVRVMDLLLDIVTARGFEQDTYMEGAIRDIGMIPRLEGTAHINIGLATKFLNNYFFNPVACPGIPRRDDPADDACIFQQYSGSLSKVRFPDYRRAYEGVNLPNIQIFLEQIERFRDFVAKTPPTSDQRTDTSALLSLGEMFSLIVYAQLVLENSRMQRLEDDLLDQIFAFLVQDFSRLALTQVTHSVNSEEQETYLRQMMKKPLIDPGREMRLWKDHLEILNGAYEMNP